MTRSIVIAGGGTAGWLAAAYLAAVMGPDRGETVDITVVEAPDMPSVGVGEGTFPTIRKTLETIGLSERDFMRKSAATFKQGVQFVDWAEQGTSYFHPFNFPYEGNVGDLTPYWLARRDGGDTTSYADAVSQQGLITRAGLAPKRLSDPDYRGPFNYAYHFDAIRFAAALRDRAKELGVRHIQGKILSASRNDTAGIASIFVEGRGHVSGDFFLDCTGFSAMLIGDMLGSKFRPCDNILLNDRALAVQVPYADADTPIVPATVATAHEAGWTWDIGLPERRGIGYVFSSAFSTETRAEDVLRAYVGPAAAGLSPRLLKFQTGFRPRQWVGNCLAVGLSAGFFEPLESTGIMLIEAAVTILSEFLLFGDPQAMQSAARAYNELMAERFDRIIDFLKLHYALSRRQDSDYWRANSSPDTWPVRLTDRIVQWRKRPISRFDFAVDYETFLPASYRYIFYGMEPDVRLQVSSARPTDQGPASLALEQVARAGPEALKHLPNHRAFLERFTAGWTA